VQHLPPNRPIRLRNATCVYCGRNFSQGLRRTKEHVIARQFVPDGAFENEWNLIAWACDVCNGRKAALEDHVSAVTMQPTVLGEFARTEGRLMSTAARKGRRAYSPLTGKPTSESNERVTIEAALGPGLTLQVHGIAAPQLDLRFAFQLAAFQVAGFFYYVTFDDRTRVGMIPLGDFEPAGIAVKSDWGNPRFRGFQDSIRSWRPVFYGTTAKDFFKIVIREAPGQDVAAWALEWNSNYRLVGYFGDPTAVRAALAALPRPHARRVNQTTVLRTEVPITAEDDHLFESPAKGHGPSPSSPKE
jgi:hypothetical protein